MDSPITTQPVPPRSSKKFFLIVGLVVLVVAVGCWLLIRYLDSKKAGVWEQRQAVIDQILKDSAETPSVSAEDKAAIIGEISEDTTSVPSPAERKAALDAMVGNPQ